MANKTIKLEAGSLGIGGDLTTFSLYHTSVTSSNLVQASIDKATITGGTATFNVNESLFTFIAVDDTYGGRQTINLPKPTVTSFTPSSGGTGDSISITGTGFAGATAVSFGGTAASSFTKNSNTSITATVGAGSTGEISVTNPKGTGTIAGFSYETGGGSTVYYLGQFGYTKTGESSLCGLVNTYPSYNLYCADYDSLSAALAASATVYTNVALTTFPPYGFYSIRTDATPPTYDDIGYYYQLEFGIPIAKILCGGEIDFD